MRGILTLGQVIDYIIGITPACAGNTDTLDFSVLVAEDHPRVCGEYMGLVEVVQYQMGSPPRVRGILA